MDREQQKDPGSRRAWGALALVGGFGLEMVAAVLISVWMGKSLDARWQTTPLFTGLLPPLAFVGVVAHLLRLVRGKKRKETSHQHKDPTGN